MTRRARPRSRWGRREQVDAIGGGDLGLEDLAEAGLAAGIDEEVAGAEGDGGGWQLVGAEAGGFGERGQEGGGLAEVVIGFEAGVLCDQLAEDSPAEVELPGLGVVALLGVEGEGQQVMDVAGQEARALGVFGGLRVCREPFGVERLNVLIEGQAEQALVQAGWQPCHGHGGVYLVRRGPERF